MLTANFLKSAFSCPGNLRLVVTPDMVRETRWLRSPYVGVVSFKVRKQMSYKASLSMQNVSSVFSTSWWTDRVALYGSTTVSDTFWRLWDRQVMKLYFENSFQHLKFVLGYNFNQTLGLGTTLYVFMILSGYSSLIFETNRVPIPVIIRLVFESIYQPFALQIFLQNISVYLNNGWSKLPEPVPPPREWVSWKPWKYKLQNWAKFLEILLVSKMSCNFVGHNKLQEKTHFRANCMVKI